MNSSTIEAPRREPSLEPSPDAEPHDFRLLLEAVSAYAVYMLTPDGIVSSWNKGAERNKGYTAQEAVGLHVSAFYTPEDRATGEPAKLLAAAEASSKHECHGWRLRKDGSLFWAHVVIESIRNETGRLVGYAKVTCDVTAQKRDHDLLTRNLDAALSNMSQGLCLFDTNERLVLANSRMSEICGAAARNIVAGTPFDVVMAALVVTHETGATASVAEICAQHRALIRQPGGGSVIAALTPELTVSIVHRPIADGNGSWVTTIEDISERSRTQHRIAHMAMHDALTDLPNRLMFRERLQDAVHRTRRGEACAVLCLDLDRFKTINDTLGHPVGDALLINVANKLRGLVRETDTVARLGGDEFAIVQTRLAQPSDATVLANRIIRALAAPQEVAGHLVTNGVSVGIALAPGDGADPDHLLKAADLALYRAKADGRGRYCYFESEMDALLQARRLMELDLRTALAAGEFELHYQPILEMADQQVCGFEALLRWHSPRRGTVPPIEFIPLAEEIGLIVDIGAWVLHTACQEAARWPEHVKVAVNVSATQFKDFGLVEVVESALAASGLTPQRLEIEITESVMIKDSEHACAVLRKLKDIGLSVSMDDFGTGYSSLGYLRSFPFDKIKIDRSFVQGLGTSPDCQAIIQAVMGICSSLGIIATAEGVETEDQMTLLREKQCHQVQGYLISRPCSADNIPRMLGLGRR